MKVVFVGGGSFRTLPVVRGALRDPGRIGVSPSQYTLQAVSSCANRGA